MPVAVGTLGENGQIQRVLRRVDLLAISTRAMLPYLMEDAMGLKSTVKLLVIVLLIGCAAVTARSQQYDQKLFGEMRWRCIGPFRGGRTVAIAGVPHQPNVFYMAAVNGGVWKTTDFGNTWNPIFDEQSSGSVGALAVAPSNPSIVYAGSGEGLQRPDLAVGDGFYKSTDAGKTWTHLGLRDAQQITAIAVDPKNPDRVFVAVEGHPYGPNAERGVFRSLDGGKSFEKVLYKDENTGAADLVMDPVESASALCGAMGGSGGSVGGTQRRVIHYPGQRAVQIDGRRHNVAADHEGITRE